MVRVRCALITTRCNCTAREVMLVSGNQNQRTITGSGWMADPNVGSVGFSCPASNHTHTASLHCVLDSLSYRQPF